MLAVACVAPVSAAVRNGSAVISLSSFQQTTFDSGDTSSYSIDSYAGTIFGASGGFGGGGAGGRSFESFEGGKVIALQSINYRYENVPMYFTYTFNDGVTVVSGYMLLTPSSSFPYTTGTKRIYIDQASRGWDTAYARLPITNTVLEQPSDVLVLVDSGTKEEFFTIGGTTAGWGIWDDSIVAHVLLSESIVNNPLYKSEFNTGGGSAKFRITTWLVKLSDYRDAHEIASYEPEDGDWLFGGLNKYFGWLFNPIRQFLDQISTIMGYLGSFVSTIIEVIKMAAGIFIGISAFYTAIAIVLSIGTSSDLFKAWGRFYRYEMRLFRFYMEIIRAVKSLVLPWA